MQCTEGARQLCQAPASPNRHNILTAAKRRVTTPSSWPSRPQMLTWPPPTRCTWRVRSTLQATAPSVCPVCWECGCTGEQSRAATAAAAAAALRTHCLKLSVSSCLTGQQPASCQALCFPVQPAAERLSCSLLAEQGAACCRRAHKAGHHGPRHKREGGAGRLSRQAQAWLDWRGQPRAGRHQFQGMLGCQTCMLPRLVCLAFWRRRRRSLPGRQAKMLACPASPDRRAAQLCQVSVPC